MWTAKCIFAIVVAIEYPIALDMCRYVVAFISISAAMATNAFCCIYSECCVMRPCIYWIYRYEIIFANILPYTNCLQFVLIYIHTLVSNFTKMWMKKKHSNVDLYVKKKWVFCFVFIVNFELISIAVELIEVFINKLLLFYDKYILQCYWTQYEQFTFKIK